MSLNPRPTSKTSAFLECLRDSQLNPLYHEVEDLIDGKSDQVSASNAWDIKEGKYIGSNLFAGSVAEVWVEGRAKFKIYMRGKEYSMHMLNSLRNLGRVVTVYRDLTVLELDTCDFLWLNSAGLWTNVTRAKWLEELKTALKQESR